MEDFMREALKNECPEKLAEFDALQKEADEFAENERANRGKTRKKKHNYSAYADKLEKNIKGKNTLDELIEAFKEETVRGVTISAQGFYGPQGRVVRLPLAMPDMLDAFESFRFGEYRITNFEMESSAVTGLATQLGHQAGTICCAIANRYLKSSNPDYKPQVRKLVEFALGKMAAIK